MNSSWNIRKLGDICTSELGKTRDEKRNKGTFRPYLCAINVQWDRFELSELKEMRFEDDEHDRYTIHKGDLVICEGGDIGRAAIWEKDEAIYYQNALHRVRFIDGIDSRFILYYLKHLKQTGILDGRYGKGATIKHLVKSSLVSIPVPVPSIAEQKRIVDELDLLSDIIRKKNAQLRDLNALTTAYFYELFGDPVENPRGWIRKRIGDIAHVKIGPFGSLLHKSDYISGGTPLVNPVHMKDLRIVMDNDFTISDSKKQELNNYLLKEGDIVIARRGDIGRCALVTAKDDGYLCGTGSMFVRPAVKIDSLFLVHLLSTKEMVRELLHQAKGVTMLNINCDIISNLSIIVPPIEEQNSYLTKIIALENQKQLILSSIHATELLLNSRSEHYFAE